MNVPERWLARLLTPACETVTVSPQGLATDQITSKPYSSLPEQLNLGEHLSMTMLNLQDQSNSVSLLLSLWLLASYFAALDIIPGLLGKNATWNIFNLMQFP